MNDLRCNVVTMKIHKWDRLPELSSDGKEFLGRGKWKCTRCGTDVPFNSMWMDAGPKDEFLQSFLRIDLDCDTVLRERAEED